MVFSSIVFLFFFLPTILLLYKLSPECSKNYVLLFSSLFFYSWGGFSHLFIMLSVIMVSYISGLLISATTTPYRKLILAFGVCVNLSFLTYYKYFNFVTNNILKVQSFLGSELIMFKQVALPIGISFYTFQAISYLVDLYREKIPVQKNLFHLALYISFFPQLIAGPIVQYSTIYNEMQNRTVTSQDFAYGVRRFVIGLGKKILIANELGWAVDRIFATPVNDVSTSLAWLAVIGYCFQIYYDFSGYSDMAIGLGRMFGFHFLENFDYPYLSVSVNEFWRRWHISLSAWFREYVYIPLGGNRNGELKTYRNLFIIFLLTGIWHGASWQFMAWGAYFGILIVIERKFYRSFIEKNRLVGHVYTLFAVMMGWVLFRANGLSGALIWIRKMFIYTKASGIVTPSMYGDIRFFVVLLVAIICCGPIQTIFNLKPKLYDDTKSYVVEFPFLMFILVVCLCLLVGNTYNPFIYFQF